jgi:hypothetical protein
VKKNDRDHMTMAAAFPGNPVQTDSRIGRVRFLLLLGLATVMLFGLILADYHHHSDLADHPDCVICSFAYQAYSTTLTCPILLAVILPVVLFLFVFPQQTAPIVRASFLLPSRAPPTVNSSER